MHLFTALVAPVAPVHLCSAPHLSHPSHLSHLLHPFYDSPVHRRTVLRDGGLALVALVLISLLAHRAPANMSAASGAR